MEAQVSSTVAELAGLSERLADPATYADHAAFRELIDHHNAVRDRADALGARWATLAADLERADAEEATVGVPATKR